MTVAEYKKALDVLDEDAFAKFRADFGGSYTTRQQYVDHFVSRPDHERRICQLLDLKTQEEKLTDATLESAKAASESARVAAESSTSARWSMFWAALSFLLALAAFFLANA